MFESLVLATTWLRPSSKATADTDTTNAAWMKNNVRTAVPMLWLAGKLKVYLHIDVEERLNLNC